MRMDVDRFSAVDHPEEKWRIRIDPMPVDDCFQPHSVELTLSPIIKIEKLGLSAPYGNPEWVDLDIGEWNAFESLGRAGQYPIMPGQFLLASTAETVYIPVDLAGRADGKSSIGRRGVGIHVTAGLLDAGWGGQVTLEVTNHSGYAFWLKPGMKICQLTFEQLGTPAERPYGHPELGSHYQGQTGPTPSAL
jgi:dCTP deaminase